MSLVSEIITQDQIQDLWGCGFTIVARRRHPDPFFVPQDMVPQGRSYQWWHLVHDKFYFGAPTTAWAPVPASRHDGYFMPFGHVGDIEVNGLGLFEKSKFEVDQERAQQIDAAKKLVDDWKERFGGELSGGFTVGNETATVGDPNEARKVLDGMTMTRAEAKTIETTVAIPKDMFPHMSAIFAERDRLAAAHVDAMKTKTGTEYCQEWADWMENHLDAPQWSTLHAILLPIAIENVRKSLKQETAS